ncbi:hypothetical protein Tco_0707572 [Tanacetum coccineum]|uniref:Uncharacterized protein n=1 Tax=Tanacetum coccineum TaxID=301880 RepID=A0ABQ4YC60_9ASTR
MKRASKGYTGENIPLFPAMIVQGPVVQANFTTSRKQPDRESVLPQPRSPTQTPKQMRVHPIVWMSNMAGATTIVTSIRTRTEKIAKSSQARRKARIVVFDDEDDLEDPSKHGRKIAAIDQDPGISLVIHDAEIQGRYGHDKEVSTAEPVSTAGVTVTTVSIAVSTVNLTRNAKVSTTNDNTMAETMVYIRRVSVQRPKRLENEALEIGKAELEEEERQRIVRVHEAASSFNVEEWEDIQARVEADEELVQSLQAEEETKRKVKTTFVPIESEGLPEQFPELANWEFKNAAKEELDQDSSRGKRW